MPLRPDQVARLTAKFPGLLVNETCSVIDSRFGRDVTLCDHANIYMSTLGDHSYVGAGTSVNWCDVGKFCSIGQNTSLGMAAHPSRTFVSTHPIFYLAIACRNLSWADQNYFDGAARTTIGHDVWIGGNVSIKSGLTIGHGAIVGAGAVVTKDIPPYAVVAGVPARKLRDRFTRDQIKALLKLEWWNRGDDWLREHFREFHDIGVFMKLHGPTPKRPRSAPSKKRTRS